MAIFIFFLVEACFDAVNFRPEIVQFTFKSCTANSTVLGRFIDQYCGFEFWGRAFKLFERNTPQTWFFLFIYSVPVNEITEKTLFEVVTLLTLDLQRFCAVIKTNGNVRYFEKQLTKRWLILANYLPSHSVASREMPLILHCYLAT